MQRASLRKWQKNALDVWEQHAHRGIVSVTTGAGKTFFALSCIDSIRPETTLVLVPTVALLDQWWEEVASFFKIPLDNVHVITGNRNVRAGTVNLAVLNTASKLQAKGRVRPCFLIVDECHKAASPQFRTALEIPKIASLGLSATPERSYDDWLNEVVVPTLGPVIFEYTYKNALHDEIIVPFFLRNVVFELEEDRQRDYDRVSRGIAHSIRKNGPEASETIALYIRRSRIMNLSLNRVSLTLKIIASHKGKRILVFHEDIAACDLIHQVLNENGIRAGLYHSRLHLRQRAEVLASYRAGEVTVLVTCRALDEGFNVPETEIGIIAASTATRRQRIQRLGRVLRPASGKQSAIIYTLVATSPEVARLKAEETDLEGVASVEWSRA